MTRWQLSTFKSSLDNGYISMLLDSQKQLKAFLLGIKSEQSTKRHTRLQQIVVYHHTIASTTPAKDFKKCLSGFFINTLKVRKSDQEKNKQQNTLVFLINGFYQKCWKTFVSYDLKFEWVILLVTRTGKQQCWGGNVTPKNWMPRTSSIQKTDSIFRAVNSCDANKRSLIPLKSSSVDNAPEMLVTPSCGHRHQPRAWRGLSHKAAGS